MEFVIILLKSLLIGGLLGFAAARALLGCFMHHKRKG